MVDLRTIPLATITKDADVEFRIEGASALLTIRNGIISSPVGGGAVPEGGAVADPPWADAVLADATWVWITSKGQASDMSAEQFAALGGQVELQVPRWKAKEDPAVRVGVICFKTGFAPNFKHKDKCIVSPATTGPVPSGAVISIAYCHTHKLIFIGLAKAPPAP